MTNQPVSAQARLRRDPAASSSDFQALADREWVPLPGGELEAPRLKALCPACRSVGRRPLCLSCFRAERERDQKLTAARELMTASEARFQCSLPFEPVNDARLKSLRATRVATRAADREGVGQYVDRRRHAQVAARHALQRIAEGLRARAGAGARQG